VAKVWGVARVDLVGDWGDKTGSEVALKNNQKGLSCPFSLDIFNLKSKR
jgi:hypothetical protein